MLSNGLLLKKVLPHILSVALLSLTLSMASAQERTAPEASLQAQNSFTSKEQGLEFTIEIPPLWVVQEGSAGYAAVLKPSSKAPRLKLPGGMVADPTITIATSKRPIEFDNTSLEKNAAEIEEKFVKANGQGSGFQIFQKNIVEDLSSGRKGLLYYVSFKTDAAEVAQAILITGHHGARYRVTLSDHKVNFDRNLELYYPFMVSINFQTPAVKTVVPGLSNDLFIWGVGVIIAGALVGLVARLRRAQRADFSVERKRKRSDFSGSASQASHSETSQSLSVVDDSAVPRTYMPHSQFGLSRTEQGGSDASDAFEPAFSESDLSAPPQSIPLSQVVDESSAPPDLKKKWKISSKSDSDEDDGEVYPSQRSRS